MSSESSGEVRGVLYPLKSAPIIETWWSVSVLRPHSASVCSIAPKIDNGRKQHDTYL